MNTGYSRDGAPNWQLSVSMDPGPTLWAVPE
jgi:hypothetical protein